MQKLLVMLLVGILSLGLVNCSASETVARISRGAAAKPQLVKLSEVPPPPAIRELRQAMEIYQPQVKILSPRPDEMLQDTEVSVRFQEKDLPLFQNKDFGLGPHLHVILDNQPYIAVYDASEPLLLKDLEPGTHTIRAFASRPWHESFKNEGAYDQTTFHVFTRTPEYNPDLNQPLLTYSRPKGSYGAEPIMLDFYLANAPLHLIAQQTEEDDILDWQVRCTINGESFIVDRWEPIYIRGLKPGKTWVQIELLDENGNLYPNAFNNTVRLIDYQPDGTDTLSKLVRGELSVAEVRGIIDPDYVYVPEVTPEPVLPPRVEEPEQPEIIEPEKLPAPTAAPDALEAPADLPVEEVEPEIKQLEEKVKEQLPEAVENFLKDDSLPKAKEAIPPSEAPPRQSRDRLKQVLPAPTEDLPAPLKLPEIMDVPPDSTLEMPLAEPAPQMIPIEPAPQSPSPQLPNPDIAGEGIENPNLPKSPQLPDPSSKSPFRILNL